MAQSKMNEKTQKNKRKSKERMRYEEDEEK